MPARSSRPSAANSQGSTGTAASARAAPPAAAAVAATLAHVGGGTPGAPAVVKGTALEAPSVASSTLRGPSSGGGGSATGRARRAPCSTRRSSRCRSCRRASLGLAGEPGMSQEGTRAGTSSEGMKERGGVAGRRRPLLLPPPLLLLGRGGGAAATMPPRCAAGGVAIACSASKQGQGVGDRGARPAGGGGGGDRGGQE